ncbi:MAG: hypothetical protein HZB76_05330 [Chlamydiae bacterium]|nr:hypothetical protein [Chlamydiota bacterium]
MSLLQTITAKYRYNYFDEANCMQVKELNIMQYALRKIFGCYAETHLFTVVQKAYKISFDDAFQYNSEGDKQKLLGMIYKANSLFSNEGITQEEKLSYIFARYRSVSNDKIDIKVKYNVKKNADKYQISSIDFKFLPSSEEGLTSFNPVSVEVYKDQSENLVIPSNPFKNFWLHPECIRSLTSGYEKTMLLNSLFANILLATNDEITGLKCYDNSEPHNAQNMRQNMQLHGWKPIKPAYKYDEFESEPYLLSKKTVKDQILDAYRINGMGSLAFAVNSLATKAVKQHRGAAYMQPFITME